MKRDLVFKKKKIFLIIFALFLFTTGLFIIKHIFCLKNAPIRILLCGFEPFGSYNYNSSWETIKSYAENANIKGKMEILKLPVSYARAAKLLEKKIDEFNPDIIIAFGMGNPNIVKEPIVLHPIAVNFDDAQIPDNDGILKLEELIRKDGPIAFWSTLPLIAIKRELLSKGILCRIFNFGGNYLSNHIFYELMYISSHRKSIKMAGFIHISPYNENFSYQDSIRAVAIIVNICLQSIDHNSNN